MNTFDAADEPTSMSMLQRVRENDAPAWERMSNVYGPLVYRWARKAGLQPDDANDLVQEVFRKLIGSISKFQKQKPSDSFRGWLYTITKNTIIDFARKRDKQQSAGGGTDFYQQLQQLPDECADESTEAGRSEVTGVYQRAIEEVRGKFGDSTWQSFYRMTVKNQSAAEIAQDLGLSTWTVYKAKARVLRKLRTEFADLIEFPE